MAKEKNATIELLRFVFMSMIVLWHCSMCLGHMVHGYVAVEFFFILSGCLLFLSCENHKDINPIQYTVSKIRRFYPEYIISLLVCYIIDVYSLWHNGMLDMMKELVTFLKEATFTQSIGIGKMSYGNVNYPCWYLSVLIFGGAVVYSLLRYLNRLSLRFLFPLIVFLVYAYLYKYGCLESWEMKGIIYIPLVRGIAGMCLGCLLMKCIIAKNTDLDYSIYWVDLALIVSASVILLIVFSDIVQDIIVLPFVCTLIVAAFSQKGCLNQYLRECRICSILGGLTFEMLLIHVPMLYVVKSIGSIVGLPFSVNAIIYYFAVVFGAFAMKSLFNRTNRRKDASMKSRVTISAPMLDK